ncbi:hypothetical protein GMSM_10970 [Geomonas sp. Red276]
MTLENLLKIGQLKSHATGKSEVGKLLNAARRNIADAEVDVISTETRFDSAYKAVMQSALVALMANVFRPDTNRPGHHMTVIQTLPTTIGLPKGRMVVLDALRRRRNMTDYTGDGVDEGTMESCIEEAKALLRDVERWLMDNTPELLEG